MTGSRSRVVRSRGGSSRIGSNWRAMIHWSGLAAAAIPRKASRARSNVARWNGPISSRCPRPARSAKCMCGSMKPGNAVLPSRSIVDAPGPAAASTSSRLPTARILFPEIASASCTENAASTDKTVPPTRTVTAESAFCSSRLPQATIVEPNTAPAPYTNCLRLNKLTSLVAVPDLVEQIAHAIGGAQVPPDQQCR